MATTVAVLEAVLRADTRDFDRSMGRTESKMSKVGKAAGVAGLAIAAGIGVAAKIGFDEMKQGELVTAQTNAVLKSTGGVAKVTAKEVDTLATSLMKKSGVDDEAIKSGSNMLLTFTNIRNEVGKGNKIFDEATKATLDMSVAMGKDLNSTAIMVGKALQDPIKGATALRKVGVALTDAQKDQIEWLQKGAHAWTALAETTDTKMTPAMVKQALAMEGAGKSVAEIAKTLNIDLTPAQEKAAKAMMEGGRMAEAQKIILKELNTEFGGSAEAAGQTFAGQINILKESFSNLMGEIVSGLMPTLLGLSKHLQTAVTFLQENTTAAKGLMIGLGALAVALIAAKVAQIAMNLAVLANPYVAAAVAVAALAVGMVVLWQKVEQARPAIVLLGTVLLGLPAGFVLAYQASERFRNIVGGALDTVKTAANGVKTAIQWLIEHIAKPFGESLTEKLDTVRKAFSQVASVVTTIVDGIKWLIDNIKRLPSFDFGIGGGSDPFKDKGSEIVGSAVSGVTSGLWDEVALGQGMGLTMTSGLRPGDPGDHGRGKAIDMSGPASTMATYAMALMGRAGLKDVIYGGLNFWQDNGRRVLGWGGNEALRGDHYSHVHASVFDKGGWLKPGLTLAYNGTGAPERVGGGGEQHFHFHNSGTGFVMSEREFMGWFKSAFQRDQRRGG